MERLVSVGQRADALICVNRDVFEDFVLIAPVDVIEIRDRLELRSRIGFLARIELPSRDEILRFMKWQRPQQHGIDHAEDCAVSADTEREGEDHNSAEERLLDQAAQGMTKILHRGIIPSEAR